MKQCPNPNCIIYTRLDELPDTYLRCPQCNEALVEVVPPTGALQSSYLAEEETSPYVPVPPAPRKTPRQPVTYEAPYDTYAEEAPDDASEPLPTLSPGRSVSTHTVVVALSGLALAVACVALVISLGRGVLGRSAPLSAASATQTAISSFRPPINTPITILPTIPRSGMVVPGSDPPSAPPPAQSGQGEQNVPNPPPSGPVGASVQNAVMCAGLEGGEPLGATSQYAPDDPFNLAVQADFGQGGVVSVLTRWYGPGGASIYDLHQHYTQSGTYYAGFTLNKKTPWPPGDYRVDIYTNDSPQPVSSVSFAVVGGQ
jgi:hypothetical protein